MQDKGLDLTQPKPKNLELQPFWRHCLPQLHQAYDGICAYVCVYIECVTGNPSADHFLPKSTDLRQAYEWNNYRLACSLMNSRKNNYEDVLDPFAVKPNSFHLNLFSGSIFPSPALTPPDHQAVQDTINRLKLDDPECRELRTRHFQEYIDEVIPEIWLQKYSPFVWLEACRQNLLR